MAESITLRFNTSGARAVSRQFDRLEKDLDGLRKSAEKMRSIGKSLTVGLTLPLAAAGTAAVKLASDAQETENLFNQAMGSMTEEANAFVQQWTEATGLDPIATRKRLATFQLMISNMGVASDRALDMSQNLTKLTVDLASLRNVSFEQAFTKLQSGLSGEMEALRRWGIIVSQARIEQVALREGIIEAGEEMTQQEKVVARYLAIMEQTNREQGDFIRTQDQLANQMRVLTDQVKRTARQFGNVLIPPVSDILNALQGLLKQIDQLSPRMKKMIVAITAAAAAAGPFLVVTSQLVIALTNLIPLIAGAGGLGGALSALASGPVAAALAVLLGTGGLIWAFIKISDTGNPAADAIDDVASSIDVMGQKAEERLDDVKKVVKATRELARLRSDRLQAGVVSGVTGGQFGAFGVLEEALGIGNLIGGGGGGAGGGGGGGGGQPQGRQILPDLFDALQGLEIIGPRESAQIGRELAREATEALTLGSRLDRAIAGSDGGVRRPGAGSLSDLGFSIDETVSAAKERKKAQESVNEALERGGKDMTQLANVTISAFGAMAQAAIRGSDQMVQVITSAFTQIIQAISGPGVGIGGLLPGPFGAIAGAVGGILTAALSGGGEQKRTQPVSVEKFGRDAEQTLEDTQQGPEEVVTQVISPLTGEVIDEISYQINRRERRDATQRLPQGSALNQGRG